MKIEDLLLFPEQVVRPQRQTSGEGDFARCLEEALKGTSTKGAAEIAGVDSVTHPTSLAGRGASPQEMLESTLGRLELFQEALARPDISLRTISSLVDGLEEDSRRLQTLSESLPASSPWRQVLEEAAALSWVECFKFRRGDYV